MKSLLKTLALILTVANASVAMAASINDNPSFDTLYVSDAGQGSGQWHKSVTVNEGDKVAFDLHYFLAEGYSASEVKFYLDNIVGSYSAGQSKSVSGRVTASNLSAAQGSVSMNFADNVRLELYNVSWQKWPCQSVSCETSFSGSPSSVISGSGLGIGNVSGSDSHYAGNLIVEFKAFPVTVSNNDCYLDGVTVPHGQSRTFYSAQTTTGTCSAIDLARTCNNGTLSGSNSYKYATCKTVSTGNEDVTTNSASNVDEDSARLNGEWEGDDNTDVWFAFDENDSTPSCSDSSQRVGRTTVDDGDDFSETVTGLDENETYYFRACAEDRDGDTISGSIRSFTTDEDNGNNNNDDDVDVTTKSATNIDEDSARLNGEMDGDDNVDVWFAFDENDSTPSCSDSSQRVGRTTVDDGDDFSETVTRLDENTKYYFRACAEDSDGSVVSGSIRSFVTDEDDDNNNNNNRTDLDAVTNVASSIGTNSARLNSIVLGEGNARCYFQYGRTSSFGLVTPSVSVDLDDSSSCSSFRSGLTANTTYYYRAVLVQGNDTEYGSTRSFRTNSTVTTTPNNPTVTNTNTTVTIVNRNESVSRDLSVTKWVSGEDDPRFDTFTEAEPGETVYYKVRVENNTNKDLEDIVVIDRIPFYLELDEDRGTDDDDDKQVRWVIDLEAGESRTFVTEMRVREDADRGDVIVSYATAEHKDYSANSNDVEIEVDRPSSNGGGSDRDDNDNNQAGFAFGAGIFPTDLTGWALLLLIILAIGYFISRIMAARDERARVMAELAAAKAQHSKG